MPLSKAKFSVGQVVKIVANTDSDTPYDVRHYYNIGDAVRILGASHWPENDDNRDKAGKVHYHTEHAEHGYTQTVEEHHLDHLKEPLSPFTIKEMMTDG